MSAIAERLSMLGAQHDLVSWAAAYGDDWRALFTACPRADWLLGLAARLGCAREALVRAAVGCTRVGLAYLPASRTDVEAALHVAERWTRGEASADSCDAARAQLEKFWLMTEDPAADSVVQAAIATLASIADPDAAAHAAACIAQAAVLAAGDCAMASALRFTQESCADAVRAELTPAELATLAA